MGEICAGAGTVKKNSERKVEAELEGRHRGGGGNKLTGEGQIFEGVLGLG